MTNIIIIQPEVPAYRMGFFGRLSQRLENGLCVHASAGRLGVLSKRTETPVWEHKIGSITKIAPGLEWQKGALAIAIKSGDIVIVSGGPRCLSNIALLIKARIKGARAVWWGHYWSSSSRGWSAWLRLQLMRLSDYVLFYTDVEKAEYQERYANHSSERVFALNNGVETDEIVKLRLPFKAAKRNNHLLFIGRLTTKTELDILFHAMNETTCANVSLEIIGNGEAEATLRAQAKDMNLDKRIRWHGGITDEQKISKIANICKLFVYPGPVGLSLPHALSYGLPAIVHDDRWAHMPEFAALISGQNGLVFKQGDSQSLAKTIHKALSDHARLDVMSSGALKTTENSFNTNDMADRFCEMIDYIGQNVKVKQ